MKQHYRFLWLVLIGTGVCVAAQADWYNDSWYYRRAITIDRSQVGGALTDFPVLVHVAPDADLASKALDSGADLVFTAADGVSQLKREIESFDGNTGELWAWVKLPALSNGADTVIYLYYGNAAGAEGQDTDTWDSGYLAVWHLDENPAGPAPQVHDSTSHHMDGTTSGNMTAGDQVSGQVGGALDLDGSDDLVNFGPGYNFGPGDTRTVEIWINTRNMDGYFVLLSKSSCDSPYPGWCFRFYSGGVMGIEYIISWSDNASVWYSDPVITTNTWHHLVYVYDNHTFNFYCDGVTVPSYLAFDRITGAPPTDAPMCLGTRAGIPCMIYNGLLDEARFSQVARSAEWVQTSYANENHPDTFLSVAGEEIHGNPPPTDTPPETATFTPTETATDSPSPSPTIPTATPSPTGPPPVGGEFPVNEVTALDQFDPSVGMDEAGAFTVVWYSESSGGPRLVRGRRFNAASTPLTSEFPINDATTVDSFRPGMAQRPNGDFLVVWANYAGWPEQRVRGRLMGADGNPLSAEFEVTSSTPSTRPEVAEGPGSFLVVWNNYASGGTLWGRVFNPAATPQGPEFRVSEISNYQYYFSVAADASGNFIVAWGDYGGLDGSGAGIFARRCDPFGTPLSETLQLNSITAGQQVAPSVAFAPGGDFVVTWSDQYLDGSNYAIAARHFNAEATPLGEEFLANATTLGYQVMSRIAMDAQGDFVLTWHGYNPATGNTDISGQWFSPETTPVGGEFVVNTYTDGNQYNPAIAMNSRGNFGVAWQSQEQDGDGWGIFGQLFRSLVEPTSMPTDTPTDTPTSTPSETPTNTPPETPSPTATKTPNALGIISPGWRMMP